jgi:hypothetical protein
VSDKTKDGLLLSFLHGEITSAELIDVMGAEDGPTLLDELLRTAIENRDPDGVAYAVAAGFSLGYDERHLDPLLILARADWHFRHEDVINALDKLRDPRALDVLFEATQEIPAYLEWDEDRALAGKAIYAIYHIPGPRSRLLLEQLLRDQDRDVRSTARRVLDLLNRQTEG